MNDDTIVVVSAYAGDQHQVEANLPVYLHHRCPVVILSPADKPIVRVADARVHCQWAGEAEWAGPKSLKRHLRFLNMMLEFRQSWFLMHDADSVCLSPDLPDYLYQSKAAWSNEVPDLNTGASLLRKVAVQPPYFFHRDVLEAIVAKAANPPTSYYGEITGDPIVTQCIDHYHHQLSAECGFPEKSFPDGASWETSSELGLREMTRKVRDDGTVFVHQVKSSSALLTLLGAHEVFKKRRCERY